MDPIMALAAKHNITVIEDCAQAPFATYKGKPVGTLGHMGVFSLNYHKHIHTGEGGLVVTNHANLAERVSLIRNHGEAVIEPKTKAEGGVLDLVNMIGFNMRLGEIEAAIGRRQLIKGPDLIDQRRANVAYLESKLTSIPGLALPQVQDGVKHVYYVHALSYDAAVTGVRRETWVGAVKAELPPTLLREGEGVLIGQGYVRPLYRQPLYQNRQAYGDGKTGCPFACPHYEGTLDYDPASFPVVEQAHFSRVITHELMRPPMTHQDLDAVVDAIQKVTENLAALKEWERSKTL
jgi:dTDP-4-amino-4,6-dideoxygalactose transaminase